MDLRKGNIDMKIKRLYFILFTILLVVSGCVNYQKGETPELSSEEILQVDTETESILEEEIKEKYSSVIELNPGEVFATEELELAELSNFFLAVPIVEGDEIYQRIYGKSYQINDDISLEELRYIKLLHYNYDGEIQVGELIVNQVIAQDCLEIFQALFEAEYEICRIVLVDDYWTGDGVESDAVSIKNNNTSSFNYRYVPGSTSRSNHALGLAIDLNPRENPYVPTVDGTADYSALDEEEYYYATNRKDTDAHVITHEDLAYQLFTEHGFTWGGDWKTLKDYQHFEKN